MKPYAQSLSQRKEWSNNCISRLSTHFTAFHQCPRCYVRCSWPRVAFRYLIFHCRNQKTPSCWVCQVQYLWSRFTVATDSCKWLELKPLLIMSAGTVIPPIVQFCMFLLYCLPYIHTEKVNPQKSSQSKPFFRVKNNSESFLKEFVNRDTVDRLYPPLSRLTFPLTCMILLGWKANLEHVSRTATTDGAGRSFAFICKYLWFAIILLSEWWFQWFRLSYFRAYSLGKIFQLNPIHYNVFNRLTPPPGYQFLDIRNSKAAQ